MIHTVGWKELRELAAFRSEKGVAVSLYLGFEPGQRNALKTRLHSLRDEAIRNAASDLGHEQREALRADLERAEDFVEQEFDPSGAHGVALFVSRLDNLFHPIALAAPVSDEVRTGDELHLAPLVPLVGRGNGTLVLLVGREQGQFFRLRGTRLVPVAERFDEQPRRHDQGGWSQANLQRHADELALDHLRAVAAQLDREVHRMGGEGRVVVACSEETWAEFSPLLSHEVRALVVGWTPADAHARPGELLELVAPLLERSHAEAQARTVERWCDETGAHGRATTGWAETLEAASDGRVGTLLFRYGVNHEVTRCPSCGRVGLAGGRCPIDGHSMEVHADGLDLAVSRTLQHGGVAIAVPDNPQLAEADGIGAILRY